jgi:RimJ/RimL family protein N-acetyltransferase
MTVRIETDRLVLRPQEPEDLDALASIFADPRVTRFLGDGRPRSRLRVELGLRLGAECWARLGFGPLSVLESGELVGDCLVLPVARSGVDGSDLGARGPEVEIGYRLAPRAWGRGVATEAAGAALRWAMHEASGPGLGRLIGVCHPENTPSQRVLEKIGMRRVGLTEAYYDRTTVLFDTVRGSGGPRAGGCW